MIILDRAESRSMSCQLWRRMGICIVLPRFPPQLGQYACLHLFFFVFFCNYIAMPRVTKKRKMLMTALAMGVQARQRQRRER